ncbi:MAG TPA: SCP2 sterol-binding domain-containing protein [Candidatus Deferrimicrobium sp.]|nr:SCP2 sterol-binding domain-containing protein [Candidatus Deferrimicrobium sp.]
MDITNIWDALQEFKKVANNTKYIQAELQNWGDRVIQLIVRAGEDCCIIVRNGRIILEKGKKENPSFIFTALDGHFVNLITGETDYTSLDILGNITFEGSESDKNKFITIIGLFVDALLGDTDFEDL